MRSARPAPADLFLPTRRIGRAAFASGVFGAALVFWLLVELSLAALPWMAEVLSPRGINAAFALNAIWLVLGVILAWSLIALAANRLRDAGDWPWWGALSVAPLAILALLNDAIFLVSRSFVVPYWANVAGLVVFGGIAAWVSARGVLATSKSSETES